MSPPCSLWAQLACAAASSEPSRVADLQVIAVPGSIFRFVQVKANATRGTHKP